MVCTTTTFQLRPSQRKKLQRAARKTNLSMSELIRRLIDRFLAESLTPPDSVVPNN